MKIEQQTRGGVTVLSLSDKIIGASDSALLNDKIHELVDSHAKKVVLDLSGVQWINSSGIGTLISGMTALHNAGGHLKLAAVPDKIKSILTITKLTTVLEIFPTVTDAITSFK
jgi:anti-sigma B factor antagonist